LIDERIDDDQEYAQSESSGQKESLKNYFISKIQIIYSSLNLEEKSIA